MSGVVARVAADLGDEDRVHHRATTEVADQRAKATGCAHRHHDRAGLIRRDIWR
jgi:hypothetical protein